MATITNNNIHVENSYMYSKDCMKDALELWRGKYPEYDVFIHRTDNDMIREWCVHNVLYELGIAKERTKDVDLNWPQKWYARVGYFVFGGICKLFTH